MGIMSIFRQLIKWRASCVSTNYCCPLWLGVDLIVSFT